MLYTNVQGPQVLVTIDDLPAACADVNCDYDYTAVSASVQSQQYDEGDNLKITVELDVTGLDTNLLTDMTIIFGGAQCGALTITADTLYTVECNLGHEPYGGDHVVEVYYDSGLIPNSQATINVFVAVNAASISEGGSELSLAGGNTLVISGLGFPNQASYV